MGLMDKVKAQATQVAQKAQEGARTGQAKLADAQSKKRADALLRDLGAAVYAERSGKADGGEGLSLATLEGDGAVILQSMTIEGLAKALAKNLGVGEDKKGPLGGLLSGSFE